jgi:hypothetical protein
MFSQDKQREEPEKQKTVAGKGNQKRRKKGMTLEDRPLLEPNAAGIDIGAREIFVAVPADRDENPVRVFPTFTADLEEMARWLLSCRITTVAMESTGVYWIPLYDVLERHRVTPCLVNARNMKNVPGRRTDWHECQWLQFLHSVGLLRAAFRPDGEVSAVRSLMRHRTDLVQIAAQHIGPGPSLMPTLSWDKAGHASSLLVKHAKIADADESTNPPRDQRNHRRDWFSDCRRHYRGGARPGGAGQTARSLTRGVDARSPCPAIRPAFTSSQGQPCQ